MSSTNRSGEVSSAGSGLFPTKTTGRRQEAGLVSGFTNFPQELDPPVLGKETAAKVLVSLDRSACRIQDTLTRVKKGFPAVFPSPRTLIASNSEAGRRILTGSSCGT